MRGAGLLLALALACCTPPHPPQEPPDAGALVVEGRRQLMGVECKVSVAGVAAERARPAIEAALDAMAAVARRTNPYGREESDVARVNEAAGVAPVRVDPDTFELLELSRQVSEQSGGAYDVTFAALLPAWRSLREDPPRLPAEEELRAARALVGFQRLVLDRASLTAFLQTGGMALGLGGIAPGRAADLAGAVLLSRGLSDFIVDGGGELLVHGSKQGTPWRLGIQHPRRPGALLGTLSPGRDGAVVTSGDYERFVEVGGVRYHHILDPRTGQPARGCAAVTLLAPSATLADALDTAVFVLGPREGMALVERLRPQGVEALIVDEDLRVTLSPGLRGLVTLE